MYATVKQAVEFLRQIDESRVEEEGYLKEIIEKKREEQKAKRKALYNTNNTQLEADHLRFTGFSENERIDQSFNPFNNPLERDQSLVQISYMQN